MSAKTNIRSLGFLILMLLPVMAEAQVELVRPADFRYHVTVDGDTLSSRSLEYKAIQDAVYYKQMNCSSDVVIHPTGVEARECFDLVADTVYVERTIFENIIETVDWQHRQSVPDKHVIELEITHNADFLEHEIKACGHTFQSGDTIPCSEMAYIRVEGSKSNRVLIVKDHVDLGMMNDFFLNETENKMANDFRGIGVLSASQIPSDQTDVPIYIDLSAQFGGISQFWDNVRSDGGDIRIYRWDGANKIELPREIVRIDTVAETGEVHFLADTLLSASDNTFYVEFGDSTLTDYLPTDTYGRNAVWGDYEFVSHDGGFSDASGNFQNSATFGGMTIGSASGQIGSATLYDKAQSQYMKVGDRISTGQSERLIPHDSPFTMQGWINQFMYSGTGVGDESMFYTQNSSGSGSVLFFNASNARENYVAEVYERLTNASYLNSEDIRGTGWRKWELFKNDTVFASYIDNVFQASVATFTFSSNALNAYFGAYNNFSSAERFFTGELDEIRVRHAFIPDDQRSIEYANQNDPSSFWGTWTVESIGGGGQAASYSAATSRSVISQSTASPATNRQVTSISGYSGATQRRVISSAGYSGDTLRGVTSSADYSPQTSRSVVSASTFSGATNRNIQSAASNSSSTQRKVTSLASYTAASLRKVRALAVYSAATLREVIAEAMASYSGATLRKVTKSDSSSAQTERKVTTGAEASGATDRTVLKQATQDAATLRSVTKADSYSGASLRKVTDQAGQSPTTFRKVTKQASHSGVTLRIVTKVAQYSGATLRIIRDATFVEFPAVVSTSFKFLTSKTSAVIHKITTKVKK